MLSERKIYWLESDHLSFSEENRLKAREKTSPSMHYCIGRGGGGRLERSVEETNRRREPPRVQIDPAAEGSEIPAHHFNTPFIEYLCLYILCILCIIYVYAHACPCPVFSLLILPPPLPVRGNNMIPRAHWIWLHLNSKRLAKEEPCTSNFNPI